MDDQVADVVVLAVLTAAVLYRWARPFPRWLEDLLAGGE